jgi:hypothetical protein
MSTVKLVSGIIIALVSSLFLVAAIGDLIQGSETKPSVLWGLMVFFFLTLAAGLYLAIIPRLRKGKLDRQRRERSVLKVIAARGGRVTPFELAAESDMDIKEAQAFLDNLCTNGIGQLQVTDTGELVYTFSGIISSSEKQTAKSPLQR